MTSRVRSLGTFVLALALPVSACGAIGLPGRASDEWTRSYPLADGGQLQIRNINGIVEIEGVGGTTVDIRAERVAHAVTDSDARDVLSRFAIKEDVAPTRISIQSPRGNGLLDAVSYEVHYHVRAPKNTAIVANTINGRIFMHGLSGNATAATTNGSVTADAVAGGITAKSTNGSIDVELGAVGADGVDLRTTNGRVSLTLPADARADVDASVTNGAISITGIKFEAVDESRRHVSGRINGGGTPITVSTTNGAIRIGTQ